MGYSIKHIAVKNIPNVVILKSSNIYTSTPKKSLADNTSNYSYLILNFIDYLYSLTKRGFENIGFGGN